MATSERSYVNNWCRNLGIKRRWWWSDATARRKCIEHMVKNPTKRK